MPRQRMIKPDMPQDEGFGSCSYIARLIFIHMLCRADDWGWFQDRPKQIKGWCFPYDNISEADIVGALSELVKNNLLEYWHDGEHGYFRYKSWERHQKIQKRFDASKYINDTSVLNKSNTYPIPITDQSHTGIVPVCNQSHTSHIPVTSRIEENRIEEKKNSTSTRVPYQSHTSHIPVTYQSHTPQGGPPSPKGESYSPKVKEIFSYWCQVMGKDENRVKCLSGSKRYKRIVARLKDGYTVEQIKQAIDGCRASPFHMGENDRGKPFNDLELICRDIEHLDQFIEIAENQEQEQEPKPPRMSSVMDIDTLHGYFRAGHAQVDAIMFDWMRRVVEEGKLERLADRCIENGLMPAEWRDQFIEHWKGVGQ